MRPGRTVAAQLAAPVVNAAIDQSEAAKRAEGAMGTGRTGGTAAINREAGTQTAKTIDDIISQTLQSGRKEGAAGLTQVAQTEEGIAQTQLANALANLGLSAEAVNAIMSNATQSREISAKLNQAAQDKWLTVIGNLLNLAGPKKE